MEVFLAACVIGLIPAFIAKSKGRNFLSWYIYGVFVWIVAFIHSLMIRPYEELLAVKGRLIKCPYCAEYIKAEAAVCKYCHNDLPEFSNLQIEVQKELAIQELKDKSKTPEGLKIFLLILLILFLIFLILTLYIMLQTIRAAKA